MRGHKVLPRSYFVSQSVPTVTHILCRFLIAFEYGCLSGHDQVKTLERQKSKAEDEAFEFNYHKKTVNNLKAKQVS